jgi:hypothetical protein
VTDRTGPPNQVDRAIAYLYNALETVLRKDVPARPSVGAVSPAFCQTSHGTNRRTPWTRSFWTWLSARLRRCTGHRRPDIPRNGPPLCGFHTPMTRRRRWRCSVRISA